MGERAIHGLIKRGGRKPADANDVRSLADRLVQQRRADLPEPAPEAPQPRAPDPEETGLVERVQNPVRAPEAPIAAAADADSGDTDAIVAAAKARRGGTASRMARGHCLIVDDSRVVRKVARRIAESLGYQVVEAENGEEALARCKVEMPALVLTDWQMPVMSGIEFVAKLRALPGTRTPTVVFCTSKGAAKDIHEGIAAGADDYVIKPFDEAQLRGKLEQLGG